MAFVERIFGNKELPYEVRAVYAEARATYRGWHQAEGNRRDIMDYNLTRSLEHELKGKRYSRANPKRSLIAEDISKLQDQMASLTPPDDEKHNWDFLKAQLAASKAYLKRLKGANGTSLKDYVESTMQVNFERVPEGMLEALRDNLFEKAKVLGIEPLNEEGLRDWRKTNSITRDEASKAFEEQGERARRRIGQFIGKKLEYPFEVVPVEEQAYWYVWADTNPETGNFRFRQNFSQEALKVWTQGKAEELGPHELGVHASRMANRRRRIVKGNLSKVFGITTVHGPEAVVEEGLGLTITHFVPGLYESLSLEGKFQVDAAILRGIVYGNLHVDLGANPRMSLAAARRYIHNFIPWEPATQIESEVQDRTKDPLLSTYRFAYNSINFLMYASTLNVEGRRTFLREIYKNPYTGKQAHELYQRLVQNPRFQGGDIQTPIYRTVRTELPRGNMFAS